MKISGSRVTSLVLCIVVLAAGLLFGCSKSKPAVSESGGVLKITKTTDALTLGNPPTMMAQADTIFAHAAIENLLRIDDKGNLAPWLATAWEYAKDQSSITLTLRKGVKFHDGTDFNAQAAKWNLDQYKASNRQELGKVKSVDIVDDNTIRLNLSKMDSLLLANLATFPGMMISPAAWQKNGGKAWAETYPVGTGPFEFVSWEKDVKQVYKKFNGYWQAGMPKLDGIEFQIIKDPMVQAATFKQGGVDVIVGLDPKTANDLAAESKYNITKTKLPDQFFSLMGDSIHPNSPFSNLKVRQAVWYAIDTKSIAKTIGYGYLEPLNQAALPGSWAFSPNVKGYPYNPEKAKQLLAEAGYPKGFKTTIYGRNIAPFPDLMTAIQGYLAKVGIEAKVDAMDAGRYDTMVAQGGGWQDALTVIPSSVVPNELGALSRNFSKAVHAKRFPSLLVSDEIQDLIGKAESASDDNTVKTTVQRLQEIATDEQAMAVWLYTGLGVAGKQPKVQADGLYETLIGQWTPESAALKK